MAISSVSLTSSARINLLSLQSTDVLLGTAEKRLATGKKVNSALDNAAAFFSSQGFLNRASDLSALKDSMSTAIQTVKAAVDALTSITKVIEQMQGLANSALQSSDAATRASLAGQFDDLRDQIDNFADDSIFNGTNLLKATPDSLTVTFDNETSTNVVIAGTDSTTAATGLNIAAAAAAWVATVNITAAQTDLNAALNEVRANAATFGSNNTLLQTRSDFMGNLISTLQVASDNLVLADVNEEGANLQALQTRNQLGVVGLSIAGQIAQSIMRLF